LWALVATRLMRADLASLRSVCRRWLCVVDRAYPPLAVLRHYVEKTPHCPVRVVAHASSSQRALKLASKADSQFTPYGGAAIESFSLHAEDAPLVKQAWRTLVVLGEASQLVEMALRPLFGARLKTWAVVPRQLSHTMWICDCSEGNMVAEAFCRSCGVARSPKDFPCVNGCGALKTCFSSDVYCNVCGFYAVDERAAISAQDSRRWHCPRCGKDVFVTAASCGCGFRNLNTIMELVQAIGEDFWLNFDANECEEVWNDLCSNLDVFRGAKTQVVALSFIADRRAGGYDIERLLVAVPVDPHIHGLHVLHICATTD
jgi:hypothetical protein